MTLIILLQVALIMLNAIFACAEIAVISMNDTKLAKMAAEGDKRAVRLARLTSQPARFLATIQVAITLSGFLGSAFAAENFSGILVDWVVSWGVNVPVDVLDSIAVILITVVLSYFTLVFGELVPKQVAMRKAEALALGLSGLIYGISKVFAPLVSFLTFSTNSILRLFKIDPNAVDDEVGEEEIRMMVDAGSEQGTIDDDEREFIQNLFEFDDLVAEELTTIEDLPEEARDYVSVISKKSERLKNLTLDLFDISKVQSGNEDVILEKIDVSVLINQSLGEHDNEIKSSELPFFVEAPKELYIAADGRKMSRVVSNLINNILKYTLKNTRVFITAFEKEGNVIIEFKNIASYPMNFNPDEITQRFTRGDESRTQEGNGLGLAIAKSYTEICNGKFEIVTDGDMFKAILTFRKYS